jgi:release factor glutamine methyltransferase
MSGTEVGTGVETVEFGGLQISFDGRVLRPRDWTVAQSWWAAALEQDLPAGDVLELCSGAGQIGLLAMAGSDRRLVCVDVSTVAASYTHHNAEVAGMSDRVSVRTGRINQVLARGELFPLIIADPPWVPRAQTTRFPDDPLLAIDGGDDGMDVVHECLRAISGHLAPGGVALLQLGTAEQAETVAGLLDGTGLVVGEQRTYGDRGVLLRIDHT